MRKEITHFRERTEQDFETLGSPVILYFVSSGLVYISDSIHTNVGDWLLTTNTLVVAETVPFVGYMTDLPVCVLVNHHSI